MTTTHQDNDHEDQDDNMRQEDITPHLSHPGTENPENPNEFHRNTYFYSVFEHQPKIAKKWPKKTITFDIFLQNTGW